MKRSADRVGLQISLVAAFLFFAVESEYALVLDWVEKGFGFPVRLVFALLVAGLVFVVFQFINYLRLSKSLRRTFRHYFGALRELSPILWLTILLMGVFFCGLAWLAFQLGPPGARIWRTVPAVFCVVSVPLSLCAWWGGIRHRRWVLKRGKTCWEALTNESGLVRYDTLENKDHRIAEWLYALRECHFIFIWAIHFSHIVGRDHPNALADLANLLKANPDAKIHALFQCPFCEEVIERSVELDCPYDDDYVTASVESVSNCLAVGNSEVRVRHGKPFFRTIIWGRFAGDRPPYGPFDYANQQASDENHEMPEQRYLRSVQDGGFVLQEYPRRFHGSEAPLVKGTVLDHGGMWNKLRTKFSQERTRAIPASGDLTNVGEESLRHLAEDLGMRRRTARKASRDDLSEYISANLKFDSFIRRIADSTALKAGTSL